MTRTPLAHDVNNQLVYHSHEMIKHSQVWSVSHNLIEGAQVCWVQSHGGKPPPCVYPQGSGNGQV